MQRVSNTEELPPKVVDEKSLLRQILLRKYGEQPMGNLVAYKTTKARHHQERNGFICTLLLPNIYPDQDFQGKRSATKKDAEKSAAAECLKFMVDEVELTTNSTYDWKAHLNTILMQNLNQSETAARNNIVYQSVKLDESSAVLYVSTIAFPQLLPGQEFFGDLSRSKKQAEQSVAQRVGTDPGVMAQVVAACRELCLADPSYGFEPSPPVQEISKLKRYEKYKAICKMRAEKARQKALPKHLREKAADAPAEPEVLPPEGQAKYRFKETHLQWRDLLVSGKIPTKSQLFAYHRALQNNLILVLPRGFGKTLIAAMVMHRMWLSTTFALNSLPRLAAAPRHSNLPPVPSAVLARNTSFAVMVVNQVALVYQQSDKLALDTGLRVFAVGSLAEFTALPGKIARTELDFLVITTGFLLQMLHRTIHSPLQLRDVCCLVFYDCLHDPFVESIMHIAQVATWKPRLLAVTTHPAFAPPLPERIGDVAGDVDEHEVVSVVQHLRHMLYGAAVYMPSLPPAPEHVRYIVYDTPDSPVSPDSVVMSSDVEDAPRSASSGPGSCHSDGALSPLLSAALQPDSPFVPPPPPPPPMGPPPTLKRLKEVSLLLTLNGYNSDSEGENEGESEGGKEEACEVNEQVVAEKVEEMVLQDPPIQHMEVPTIVLFRPPQPPGRPPMPPLPPGPPPCPCPVLGPPPVPALVSTAAFHPVFAALSAALPVPVGQECTPLQWQPQPSVWVGFSSQPPPPPPPFSPPCQEDDQNGMRVVYDDVQSSLEHDATAAFVPPPMLTVPRVFSQHSVVSADAAEGKYGNTDFHAVSREGAEVISPRVVPHEVAVSAHSSPAGLTSPECLDPPAAVTALIAVLKAQDDGGQGNVLVYFDDPATAHRLLTTITQQLPLLACTVVEGRHEATLCPAPAISADGVLGEIDIDAEDPITSAEETASKVRVKRYEATANRAAALSVREKVLLPRHLRQESSEVKGSDAGDQEDAYQPSTAESDDTTSSHPGGDEEEDKEVESSVADSLYLEDLVHHMDEAVELISLLSSGAEEVNTPTKLEINTHDTSVHNLALLIFTFIGRRSAGLAFRAGDCLRGPASPPRRPLGHQGDPLHHTGAHRRSAAEGGRRGESAAGRALLRGFVSAARAAGPPPDAQRERVPARPAH